jgi:hypothetical protein
MDGYGCMTTEQMRFEMDAEEFAEHQAYQEARHEMKWD